VLGTVAGPGFVSVAGPQGLADAGGSLFYVDGSQTTGGAGPHTLYELDPATDVLFSEDEAGNGIIENTHTPNPEAMPIFADSLLYVNTDECTSCTACYQADVCPVGAIYPEEQVPDGGANARYNAADPNKGHDHTFFVQHSRDVFAD